MRQPGDPVLVAAGEVRVHASEASPWGAGVVVDMVDMHAGEVRVQREEILAFTH